jgi:hypothetical protein
MSEYELIESKQIVWCNQDDRYVYIEKVGDDIVGLNFMQGEELDEFKHRFMWNDLELIKFYNAIHRYLGGKCELDRINQAIWAYVSYRND